MNLIPGLSLRVTDEEEIIGTDDAEMGEFAYDFVELERETGAVHDTGLPIEGTAHKTSEEDYNKEAQKA